MKISIGARLFVSVLLAILAVAASSVVLLRQNVLASFGDYAVAIELDRLDELSASLAQQYRNRGGWRFLPGDDGRRRWIAHELARLQEAREQGAPRPLPPPPAPAAPAEPANMVAMPAPPVAPVAPVAPAPPAPPPPPLPPPDIPEPGMPGLASDLHERVTLLDAQGRYLAGRVPGTLPLARRAITVDNKTVGYLGVARSHQPSDAMAYAFLAELRASLWMIGAAAVALSALAAVLLARHFRRPIDRLARGAGELAAGNYGIRLPHERSDELGDLARHFNALAERLSQAETARRQWVADTSHELRTPLAVLRAQLEAIQDGVRSATPDTVDAMLRQVLSLNKLIDELYALARADVGELACRREAVDLWRLAGDEAQAFAERIAGAGLRLDIGPAPVRADVLADPDRMRQVLDNLFENSLRYTAAGGSIRLHAHADQGSLHLTLDDSAPGVPDEALARLSERFYRVDASRSRAHGGAGLGLALCRRLLEAQGAGLAFAHSPLGGLRVTLSLPLASKETA
ncbi:ATP-binding protein [Massilia sp. ZL223]|uniref:ATP-binding protein n=1 Tax=Massilia sp. ZL223 TaxID=2824904 RepID=UPI001B81113B|nr:HAMP domain-containing protein [Massilia sp. ZL223]